MPYQIITTTPPAYGSVRMFGKSGSASMYNPANVLAHNPFLCCGIDCMNSFGVMRFTGFADKAEYLAGLYISVTAMHVMYAITDAQAKNPTYCQEHQLFLEIGAEMLAEFPNLTHGPNRIQIWVVNLREAIGRYLDQAGHAMTAPPAVPATPIEEVKAKRNYVRKVKIVKENQNEPATIASNPVRLGESPAAPAVLAPVPKALQRAGQW